jgi:IS30 family transposase
MNMESYLCIAALVERHSRYAMLVKVSGKETASVVSALIKQVNKLPAKLLRSRHGTAAPRWRATGTSRLPWTCSCIPVTRTAHGSEQHENTNGPLRQYFPKGVPVDGYAQAELNKVVARLNGRPRQTLQFMNPAEKLVETLDIASTG